MNVYYARGNNMPRVRKLPPRLTVDLWNKLVDDYPRKKCE